MPRDQIPIRLTGGINNRHTPLDLFLRNQGELVNLVNADTSIFGEIRPLWPLTALNTTAESSLIHSLFEANDVLLVGSATALKYLNGSALTSLLTGLSGNNISFAHVGENVFLADGTNKKAVYLDTPSGLDWGCDIPAAGPTVAAGAAGNPNGTYTCYYRYKINLPDGSSILTALSTIAADITVSSEKIEWSNLVHSSFAGASSVKIQLYRTATGWADIYRVTTLDEGTESYSDDLSDVALQAKPGYSETGYWPPPDNPSMVMYHPGADRVFCTVDNSIYWSEAAKYHIFVYDPDVDEYSNVNDVFLSGEDITGLVMIDEQLYIGSKKTWRRLRGTDPDTWVWEDTSAEKGPISTKSAAATRWGVLYPGNDGRLWMFNGFNASPFMEKFVFDTNPDSTCHATFDGRFYRLFYGDTTYPELIIDFYGYSANQQPKVIKSTRAAESSFYCNDSDKLYHGDEDGYVRNGNDTSESVEITIETPEIPTEDLTKLGDYGSLCVRANTQGNDLTITPKKDGVSDTALTPISTTSLDFEQTGVSLDTYYTLSFILNITAIGAVRIMDPIMLAKEDG